MFFTFECIEIEEKARRLAGSAEIGGTARLARRAFPRPIPRKKQPSCFNEAVESDPNQDALFPGSSRSAILIQ